MLQPKKPNSDKLLKDLYKKQQSLEKIDEENQFKSNYTPQSLKYQKQRKYLNDKKSEIKTDNSTNKDKEFNKDIYDQKEWDDKKWGYAENAASIAELGNFVPHPVAQGVGKVGAIASTALSARKAKLAYDNEDYKNMGLNLGMMGLSAGLGSRVLSRSTPKLSKLDSFERAIAPKSFKSNIVNGYELGRITSDIPSYINVLNQKSGQSAGNLLLNRGALGTIGVDLNTDFSTEQNKNTQYAMGGNIKNMRRYAMGGDLTQFNEGGLHENNPNGGVMIGNNNSVEQGETKQDNFVYSNRIFLDDNIVSQYNLPKSLVGKSVADATKFIDNKFKGRNDKISQSTKNGMLSKIAEAQEAMKPQEPEMEQTQEGMEQQISPEMMGNNQMWDGGFKQSTIGQGFGKDATGAQQSAAVGAGLGTLGTAMDLGKTAFGKPAQNTDGLVASADVNQGSMITSGAMKGAQAGMAFGPWGAAIGGVVGLGAGIIGGAKAKKAALENSNAFARNQNRQFDDQYAMGGEIGDPTSKVVAATGIGAVPVNSDLKFDTKQIVHYQPGVTSGRDGTSGFYIYNKKPTEAGFDYKINREFVRNENMAALQRTPQWQNYMRSKSMQPKQFANGGKLNQMFDGGIVNNPFDKYSKQISSKLDLQPINQVIPSFINKGTSINNAQAIIGTKVDGDFGKNSKLALDKYRQSKGMSNVGQPLSAADYTAMGLTTDGYKINKNAFRQQIPENLNLKLDSPEEGFKKYTNIENNIEAGKDKKSIVGKGLNYVNDNLGNIARYAPIAANALQLAQLKKPQGERLDRLDNRYRPEYVDEAQLQNIADQTMNNSINAVGQSGASQGQLRSSIIGSQLQRTKAISDSYAQAAAQNRATNDRAQSFNASIDQTNLQQSNSEKDINARDQAAYRNEKSKYITALGSDVGEIGKEQVYKDILAKSTGYKWDGEYVKSPDGNVVTDPDTNKPMTQEKLQKLQSSKDKKALGGYLIKNRK